MATPLDLGLLERFNIIFPMIFIFVIIYALLTKTEVLGKDKGAWNAMVAISFAMMTLFVPVATKTVARAVPQLALVMILFFFIIFGFMAFGIKESAITEVVTSTGNSQVKMIILFILVGIFVSALASVISEDKGFTSLTQGDGDPNAVNDATGVPTEQTELFRTLFHPKVLGMLAILLIMIFTTIFMASPAEKPF